MKNHLLIYSALGLILAGCQNSPSSSAPKVLPTPVLNGASFKAAEVRRDSQTGITVTTQEVTDESLAKLQQEAQLTALSELPITSGHNTNIYALSGDDFKAYGFVSPKIYAYSTNDGARISTIENADGTVSIPFQVAMISGLESKIADPSGRGMTEPLPETFLVKDTAGLQAELDSFGKNKIALLPGCVKKLVLKVVDREFDVTPKDLSTTDYCDNSKPFTVALRTDKKMAQYILQEALYNSLVDLRADFQTRVPYMVSKVTVKFDKNRIYDELDTHLKANYKGLAEIDARYHLEKIMKDQVLSVNIIGNYSVQLEAAVDAAMRMFFTPVPDVRRVELGCSGAMVCLTINKDYRTYDENLEFMYQQTSSTLASRNFVSTTRLQPVNDRVIEIGNASTTLTDDLHKPTLKNDGSSIETGLTVQDGDIFEIEPTYLTIEQRQLDIAKITRTNNTVCIKTTEVKDCDEDYPTDPCVTNPANPEIARPCGPPRRFCTTRTVCAQTENQWVDTTLYSMDIGKETKIDHPVGKFQEIYEGLALKFTYRQERNGVIENKEVLCPLKNFSRVGQGQRISVRIENNAGCDLFGPGRNNPMLSMVNNISFPMKYKTGKDVVNWKGDIIEQHLEATYVPPVGFGGRISIRGYQITNQSLN
ncbi:MAG: hypothetical protein ACM3MG_05730 [Bacillota bacterium]